MADTDSIRAPRATKPSPLNIDREVAVLKRMSVRELKRKFEQVFGEECRSHHKQWLIKRIAWRLQANAEGDLSERARRRAMELANDADLRLKAPPQRNNEVQSTASGRVVTGHISVDRDPRIPLPGMTIERVYKGRDIRVRVLDDGFEYEGEKFASLSAVAKAITGSHTSGFLFFRLNGKG